MLPMYPAPPVTSSFTSATLRASWVDPKRWLSRVGALRGRALPEGGMVDAFDLSHHRRVGEHGICPPAAGFAQAVSAIRVLQQLQKGVAERGRVAWWDQQTFLTVAYLVRHPAHGAGDEGDAGRHRLEDDQRRSLRQRGDHQNVEEPDELPRIRAMPEKANALAKTETIRETEQLLAKRTVADDEEAGRRARRGNASGGFQEVGDPLLGLQPGDYPDQRSLPPLVW